MNKSRGNMYPWVTHMWSPITGCGYQCKYCYARPGKPHMHENRLQERLGCKLGCNRNIFVNHMSDMFCPEVSDNLVLDVLKRCRQYQNNTYTYQTKNPKRYMDFVDQFPSQSWFGTTIETNRVDLIRQISKAPDPIDRVIGIIMIKNQFPQAKTFITIEPILDFDLYPMVYMIKTARPDFVNIGADSKHHKLPEPSGKKVLDLVHVLGEECPVIKIKSNLDRLIKNNA